MSRSMAHRGPDGEHFFESPRDDAGFGCLLAHRRLSILDLSTAADQPMTDPAGGQTIVFNGEIYNYVELRSELQQSGETFTSTGDTAVMLRMLAKHGPESVARLRGMFAFGLWDPKERTLTVARDPHGIKPLYLARNPDPDGDWSLIFASEVRAILGSGLIGKPRLDPAGAASVVWNGFVTSPGTMVRGIETIWPGEIRQFDARGRQTLAHTYWTMPRPGMPITLEALRAELLHCVKIHLASDVPLGVFLSGGVDSSAIANLAQRASDRPINTFTLTFEEKTFDEGVYAKQIAQQIGSNHREILLTEDSFVGSLDTAIDTLDQPTFDGLNSYFMSKAVREAGLTVALVGTGGDELFGGYTSFRDLPRLLRALRAGKWLPRNLQVTAAKLVRALKERGERGEVRPQTRWAKLPAMVGAGDDLLTLYQLSYALFLPEFQADLLGETDAGRLMPGLRAPLAERLEAEIRDRSPLSAISVLEQRLFLGERLMRDSDAASMAVSLELRTPLVDSVLTEHVMRLDDAQRYHPIRRKQALRTIGLEGLDQTIFDRPKSGFVLPFDRWIRQRLGKAMHEVMTDARLATNAGLNPDAVGKLWRTFQSGAAGMYWSRVWAIYVLIRWCAKHNVSV
jgi:asparagine synthase (glutamine-hydrolysing)